MSSLIVFQRWMWVLALILASTAAVFAFIPAETVIAGEEGEGIHLHEEIVFRSGISANVNVWFSPKVMTVPDPDSLLSRAYYISASFTLEGFLLQESRLNGMLDFRNAKAKTITAENLSTELAYINATNLLDIPLSPSPFLDGKYVGKLAIKVGPRGDFTWGDIDGVEDIEIVKLTP